MELYEMSVCTLEDAYQELNLPYGHDFTCYSQLFNHYWQHFHIIKRRAIFAEFDQQYCDGLQKLRLATEAFILLCQQRYRGQNFASMQFYRRLWLKQVELAAVDRGNVLATRQRVKEQSLRTDLSFTEIEITFAQIASMLKAEAATYDIDIRKFLDD